MVSDEGGLVEVTATPKKTTWRRRDGSKTRCESGSSLRQTVHSAENGCDRLLFS
jgi:hypothetical protein